MLGVHSAASRSATVLVRNAYAASRSSGANRQRPTAVGAGPISAYATSRFSPLRQVLTRGSGASARKP